MTRPKGRRCCDACGHRSTRLRKKSDYVSKNEHAPGWLIVAPHLPPGPPRPSPPHLPPAPPALARGRRPPPYGTSSNTSWRTFLPDLTRTLTACVVTPPEKWPVTL